MNELPGYKPPAEVVPPEEASLVIEDDDMLDWRSGLMEFGMILAGVIPSLTNLAPWNEVQKKGKDKPSLASSR